MDKQDVRSSVGGWRDETEECKGQDWYINKLFESKDDRYKRVLSIYESNYILKIINYDLPLIPRSSL